jgi:single-strand DNA-binding protein
MNKQQIIGNLTRDPELRYLPSGKPVTSFTVAVNERRKNGAGETTESVEFFQTSVFGNSAEACAQYLTKGSKVYVDGRFRLDHWQDREGKDRVTPTIIASDVQFLGRPRSAQSEPAASEEAAPSAGEIADDDIPF